MKYSYLFKEYVPKSLFKIMNYDEKFLVNECFKRIVSIKFIKYVFIISTFALIFISMCFDNNLLLFSSILPLLLSIFLSDLEEKLEKEVEVIILDMMSERYVVKNLEK